MKRNTLVVASAALLVAGLLTGCSDDDKGGSAEKTTTAESTDKATDKATDGTEEETDEATEEATEDGGDDSSVVEAFCTDGQALADDLNSGSFLADFDPSDPAASADAIKSLAEDFGSLEAPSEIADDWKTVTDALADMGDSLATLDMTDPDSVSEFTELTDSMTSGDVQKAADNVDAYTAEHCEA